MQEGVPVFCICCGKYMKRDMTESSKAKVFTILIKGSFGLFFKIRHLNFTTNGCSFFIHLIGETAVFN